MQDLLVQGGGKEQLLNGVVIPETVESKMRLLGDEEDGGGSCSLQDGATTVASSPADLSVQGGQKNIESPEQPPSKSYTENVYESQRTAQSLTADLVSDADSWDDLEQSFSRVYEPIPRRLPGGGSGIPPHLEEGDGGSTGQPRQQQVVAQVHFAAGETDSEFSETDYVTRSELYHNIQNLQDTLVRRENGREEDTHSWRSLPSQLDDPVYISRSEILSRVDPTYASRAEVARAGKKVSTREATYVSRSEILARLMEMREGEDERGLSPAYAADASWDVCSCVSCEHCGTEHASASEAECLCSAGAVNKRHEELSHCPRTPLPATRSLLSQDSWSNGEFEKIYEPVPGLRQEQLVSRTLEEQEKRLRKLVHAEEERASLRRPQYLPVDVWSVSESEDVYESLARVARASVRASKHSEGSQRGGARRSMELEVEQYVKELLLGRDLDVDPAAEEPVVQAITRHICHDLNLRQFRDEEERIHEIRERLKKALAQDWETLSNINLGHIYVPMEESTKSSPKLPVRENTDYDTFGSIDSLIFEPKVATTADDDVDSDSLNVERLLNLALEQPYGDPTLTAKTLLATEQARREVKEDQNEEEGEEEETPVPTPVSSATLPESEPDHFLYDADEEATQLGKQGDRPLKSRKKSTILGGSPRQLQKPWPQDAGLQDQEHRGRSAKLPFRQKIYNGLVGLGFLKFGPKEAKDPSLMFLSNGSVGPPLLENSHYLLPGKTKPLRKEELSLSQKDLQRYESFKLDFQRLSGGQLRLPSEDDSNYDYHPDHRSPLDLGGASTTTSNRDTLDSETDSATSLGSVIFRGEQGEPEPRRKKLQSAFRHKFVVNRGNESDTSDLLESKSVSLGMQPFLDSDTSWDYMEAGHALQNSHRYNPAPVSVPGPHVVANLRRKTTDVPEDLEVPQSLETPMEGLDRATLASSPSVSSPALPPVPSTQLDLEHGRRLFHVYQQRQVRGSEEALPGGSSTTTSHDYQDAEDVYDVCGRALQHTPPVVLLKHHVYQSIESLASRLSSAPSLKTAATDATLEEGELQLYGSRHGEPIYGVRNSRLFHSMNGAFVNRKGDDGNKTPIVIRKGQAVELTEEMFRGGAEDRVEQQLANMTFHTTLLPGARDTMFFHNTVSSTESREVHSYENDSEIYGTRAMVCEELLRASREQLVGEEQKEKGKGEESEAREDPISTSVVSSAQEPETLKGQESRSEVEEQGASTDKIRRVQRLGVSITGNNDMMIKELKLKLRSKFNDSQGVNEVRREDHIKGPLTTSLSSDSVALKREQLAPHMNKILGSLQQRRLCESNGGKEAFLGKCENATHYIPPEHMREVKEEKQEKNEREKERETIMVERENGRMEQVFVPTPDYTPVSTLPRDRSPTPPPPLPPLYSFPSQDLSFDLTDLEKFVNEHFTKNKDIYLEPGLHHLHHPQHEDARNAPLPHAADIPSDNEARRAARSGMRRKLSYLDATWSDLESLIFAEDEKGSEAEAAIESVLPMSRMEGYKSGEGLLWEQLAKMRRSTAPEDQERWQLEKTKRMLLWIHLSGDSTYARWCHSSRWWKVRKERDECLLLMMTKNLSLSLSLFLSLSFSLSLSLSFCKPA